MKTQQLLVRIFNDISIRQNHLTKMFCLTDINKLIPGDHSISWSRSPKTQGFIEAIQKEYSLPEEAVIKIIRGRNASTWVHPLLLIDFAMWVSPELKVRALAWLHDHLCEMRDVAGETHKEMCQAIDTVLRPRDSKVYAEETWMLQSLAGIKTGERNLATGIQVNTLNQLQRANTKLIMKGITNRHKRRGLLVNFLELLQGEILG